MKRKGCELEEQDVSEKKTRVEADNHATISLSERFVDRTACTHLLLRVSELVRGHLRYSGSDFDPAWKGWSPSNQWMTGTFLYEALLFAVVVPISIPEYDQSFYETMLQRGHDMDFWMVGKPNPQEMFRVETCLRTSPPFLQCSPSSKQISVGYDWYVYNTTHKKYLKAQWMLDYVDSIQEVLHTFDLEHTCSALSIPVSNEKEEEPVSKNALWIGTYVWQQLQAVAKDAGTDSYLFAEAGKDAWKSERVLPLEQVWKRVAQGRRTKLRCPLLSFKRRERFQKYGYILEEEEDGLQDSHHRESKTTEESNPVYFPTSFMGSLRDTLYDYGYLGHLGNVMPIWGGKGTDEAVRTAAEFDEWGFPRVLHPRVKEYCLSNTDTAFACEEHRLVPRQRFGDVEWIRFVLNHTPHPNVWCFVLEAVPECKDDQPLLACTLNLITQFDRMVYACLEWKTPQAVVSQDLPVLRIRPCNYPPLYKQRVQLETRRLRKDVIPFPLSLSLPVHLASTCILQESQSQTSTLGDFWSYTGAHKLQRTGRANVEFQVLEISHCKAHLVRCNHGWGVVKLVLPSFLHTLTPILQDTPKWIGGTTGCQLFEAHLFQDTPTFH